MMETCHLLRVESRPDTEDFFELEVGEPSPPAVYGNQDLIRHLRSLTTSKHEMSPWIWDPEQSSDPSTILEFIQPDHVRPADTDPSYRRYVRLCGMLFNVHRPWRINACETSTPVPRFSLCASESPEALSNGQVVCLPDTTVPLPEVLANEYLFTGNWSAPDLLTRIAVGRFVLVCIDGENIWRVRRQPHTSPDTAPHHPSYDH